MDLPLIYSILQCLSISLENSASYVPIERFPTTFNINTVRFSLNIYDASEASVPGS